MTPTEPQKSPTRDASDWHATQINTQLEDRTKEAGEGDSPEVLTGKAEG
jgi:hypothetical protein